MKIINTPYLASLYRKLLRLYISRDSTEVLWTWDRLQKKTFVDWEEDDSLYP